MYLRRVNHTNHANLTMSDLAAVEPDRVCIINSQRPDRLKRQKGIQPGTMLIKLPFRY